MSIFITKIMHEKGGEIRLIKATENNKPCWFYVRITAEKYKEYNANLKTGKMDIAGYGEILESDWGDYPPHDVIQFIKEKYGYEIPMVSSNLHTASGTDISN